ncbi:hypothetical protein PSPO01_08014 [Paraphaeosphaeria sporulosa]
MVDISEPDTRDAVVISETTSTFYGFVAMEATSNSTICAQAPLTTSTSRQTEGAVATAGPASLTRDEIYAGDDYIGSVADFETDDYINTAGNETTETSQELAAIPQESTATSQEPIATTADSARASQNPVDQQIPESTLVSTSFASASLTASSPSSNALSDTQVKQILESIPFREYYQDWNLNQLRNSIKSYEHSIEKAKKASDGMFDSVTELDWKIRTKKAYITLVMREQENKKQVGKIRHKIARPFAVIRAKNATDPCICDDLQPPPAVSDPNAELREAVKGWRDTVDGRAEDYRDTTDGTHWWKHMESEDSDGIDNNEYHDYFPNVPRKVVYHSTAVQTKMITSPLMYEKVFGKEPNKVESRKILRTIGSVDYVDQSEVWYGKPFLASNGPYFDTQTKTQDSGFQIMDFEIREANILKTKAKASITASKLNKLSIERDNGIRVFAEPSKARVVHSQQFKALRANIDRAGSVERYGSFTPMIHNVVYDEIKSTAVASAIRAQVTSHIRTPSKNLPQPATINMIAMEQKKIPSYCSSPSAGLYEDVQRDRPKLFENGWPIDQFPLKEIDGTYSHDVFTDFGLPNSGHPRRAIPQIVRTTTHPDAATQYNSAKISTQQTPDDRTTSRASTSSISMKGPHSPTKEEGHGRTRKRSICQASDEGHKSHSPSKSSYKRPKFEKRTTPSSSHFSTPYGTLSSSNAGKASMSISSRLDTATPKSDLRLALVAQISSKRKRDASPTQEPSDKIEQSNSKRPRLQPASTPIRRLPPTESTLKVINPKSNLKAIAFANQKNARPDVPQVNRMEPYVNANTTLSKVQPQKPAQKQVQQPISAVLRPNPAPAFSRSAWANHVPTVNRDNKENPNRWRINLGAAGLSRRHDPYGASGRPGRRS